MSDYSPNPNWRKDSETGRPDPFSGMSRVGKLYTAEREKRTLDYSELFSQTKPGAKPITPTLPVKDLLKTNPSKYFSDTYSEFLDDLKSILVRDHGGLDTNVYEHCIYLESCIRSFNRTHSRDDGIDNVIIFANSLINVLSDKKYSDLDAKMRDEKNEPDYNGKLRSMIDDLKKVNEMAPTVPTR